MLVNEVKVAKYFFYKCFFKNTDSVGLHFSKRAQNTEIFLRKRFLKCRVAFEKLSHYYSLCENVATFREM